MTWLEGARVVERNDPLRGTYPTCFYSSPVSWALHYHCYDKPLEIPPSFHILAYHGQTGEGVAVVHKRKPWIGVLFHPEVSGSYGIDVLRNFLYLIYMGVFLKKNNRQLQ
jgi:anthranilate/para-aminobenzoate synthase component II